MKSLSNTFFLLVQASLIVERAFSRFTYEFDYPSLSVEIKIGSSKQAMVAQLSFTHHSYIKTTSTVDPNIFTGATKELAFAKENSSTYFPGVVTKTVKFGKHDVLGRISQDNIEIHGNSLINATFLEPIGLVSDIDIWESGFLRHPASLSLNYLVLNKSSNEPIKRAMKKKGSNIVTIKAHSNKEPTTLTFEPRSFNDRLLPGTITRKGWFSRSGIWCTKGSSISLDLKTGKANSFKVRGFMLTESPIMYLPQSIYSAFKATYNGHSREVDGLEIAHCHEIHTLPTFILTFRENVTVKIPPKSYVHVTEKECVILVTRAPTEVDSFEIGLTFLRDRSVTLDYDQKRIHIGPLPENALLKQMPPPLVNSKAEPLISGAPGLFTTSVIILSYLSQMYN